MSYYTILFYTHYTEDPRLALEARVSYYVYNPGTGGEGDEAAGAKLETLVRCLRLSRGLASRGLVSGKMEQVVTSGITRWMEHEPLAHIYAQRALVRGVAEDLPAVHALLSGRMWRLAPQRFEPLQLMGFVLVLLDFREHGLALLDEALEQRLVDQSCGIIRSWPTGLLAAELGGGGALLLLSRHCDEARMCVYIYIYTYIYIYIYMYIDAAKSMSFQFWIFPNLEIHDNWIL